jgi:xylulose-5-phosphate/fructose-6-phosphate phosphoketolase
LATRCCTPTGAVLDNPDLLAPCVAGTGRLRRARWRPAGTRTKFLNPARDGAVLPVPHLNGYKIANPTAVEENDADIYPHSDAYGLRR